MQLKDGVCKFECCWKHNLIPEDCCHCFLLLIHKMLLLLPFQSFLGDQIDHPESWTITLIVIMSYCFPN